MLEPVLYSILNKKKIVLASSSPRRKEVLKTVGLQFDVIPSQFDESSVPESKYADKRDYVLDLAEYKVMDVFDSLKNANNIPDLIIGADTIVELNNKIFGKPADKDQAVEYLKTLSGQTHTVHTAVVIKTLNKAKKFVESTRVTMAPLNIDTIKAYVETGDPLDKAGAYGIQCLGGSLIEKIEGDFYNVTGLPLHKFCLNLLSLLEEL